MTGAEFKIFSGALTPYTSGDGKKRLRTIASSSVEDLGGDVVTLPALQAMAESAKGMTIFRNHSYRIPDDVLGYTEGAEVKHAGTDGNGKPIYDLMLDIVVREDQKSVETFEAIESGVKLGTSIGALIPDGGARKNDSGGYTYDMLNLKEASIVGIPQNPRSWVEYATKAMKVAEMETDEDEDTNDEFHTSVEEEAPAEEPATAEDTDKAIEPEVTKGDEEPAAETLADLIATAEVIDETGEPDEAQKDADPDLTTDSEPTLTASADADVASEETPAQELDESAPDPAADSAPVLMTEEAELLESTLTRSVDVLTDMVKTLTRERGVMTLKVKDAEAARDAAVQAAKDAVANANLAMTIAQQFANTPMARKAVFDVESKQLSDAVKRVYSPEVIKMLENNDGS